MPNICTGFMNVRGYAPNVDEFVAILQADYSYYNKNNPNDFTTWCTDLSNFTHIPHFFRVFEAQLINNPVWHSGVYKCVSISIEVAWSVYCAMMPGPFSYYDVFEKEHHGNHFGSNIIKESKRLQLEIEIWSYEPGMMFQEHYKICSGVLVKNEEFNFKGSWLEDYSNYQEFKDNYKGNEPIITEQEFNKRIKNENYWYEYDLHEEKVDFEPKDPPKYLANIVMVKPKEE